MSRKLLTVSGLVVFGAFAGWFLGGGVAGHLSPLQIGMGAIAGLLVGLWPRAGFESIPERGWEAEEQRWGSGQESKPPLVSRSYVSSSAARVNQQFERDAGRLAQLGYRITHQQWTGTTQLNVTYELSGEN